MNKLVWRGETVNGKYLGEVALLTDLSPVVHCETFVDGHWRLWSYIGEREQVIQQGQAPSLAEAQQVCEQTALAVQGLSTSPPIQPHMQPMPMMPPMYMHQYPPMFNQQSTQVAYEEVVSSMSLQELRFKFRRWAISLTMIGGVFLSIWYSMMLKPISTISLLLVLASIVWGAQSLIKSFKRQKVAVSTPTMDEGITIFPSPQILQPSQLSAPSFMPQQMQSIPIQTVPQLPMPNMQNMHTEQTNFYNPQLQMQNYSRSNG